MKTCTACGQTKTLDEFCRSKHGKFGKASQCKPCARIKNRAWAKANPETVRKNVRLYTERHHPGRTGRPRGSPAGPLEPRFWAKVAKTDTCWLWTGTLVGGYGSILVARRHEKAHRVSWTLHYGEIPEGLFVCHKCDVRECVRPDHLFLGTQVDNMRDCRDKGRMRGVFVPGHTRGLRGEDHPFAKLTLDVVRDLRARHAAGEGTMALAKSFGLIPSTVSQIVNRRSWTHV